MKTASFFGLKGSRNKIGVEPFLLGLQQHGYSVGDYPIEEVDLAVFTGQPQELDELRAKARQAVVIDLGYMRRASPSNPNGYVQVGLRQLCWTPKIKVPLDRFDELNLAVEDDVNVPDGDWMIAGQVPSDTQHRLDEDALEAYYVRTFEDLLSSGVCRDRIYLRRHPYGPIAFRRCQKLMRVEFGFDRPLAEALRECKAIVTYNSTTFYEATLAGVPVVCHESAHYAKEANTTAQLRYRTANEKLPFLARMAYAQWTSDELRRGDAIAFLEDTKHLEP